MRVGGLDDFVSLQTGVRYLAADILVGNPDDHAVLGRIILILVLNHQALPGKIISFALTAPAELDLVTLEVSLVLDNLHENLKRKPSKNFQSFPNSTQI